MSGTYTVCLTVSCCNDPTGATAITICHEVTVECGDCPKPCELYPGFNQTMDPITIADGCCMNFFNNVYTGPFTTLTGYAWDFGDGNTSTAANPSHCYATPGAYTVCLTVYGTSPDGDCQATYCFTVNCDCEDTCPADVNHDGHIGVSDLLEILGVFNQYCP
jgi:PKD repeat protein